MCAVHGRWRRRRACLRPVAPLPHLWPIHGEPPLRCAPSEVAPRILFRDEAFVILDKPPDVRMDGDHAVVTMAKLAEAWTGTQVRFAHRLDYGTSGIIVGALTKEAAALSGAALEAKRGKKIYVAVCCGSLRRKSFVITSPLVTDDGLRVTLGKKGKPSKTKVKVLMRGTYFGRPVTKLQLQPVTGRRHQLRVHLASIGHPLVGDATYDDCPLLAGKATRMMLHAKSLYLPFAPAKDNSLTAIHAETPDPFPFDTHGILRPIIALPLEHSQAAILLRRQEEQ